MAQKLYIWKDNEPVKVSFEDHLNGTVKKIVNINNKIFLSTTSLNIYYGDVVSRDDDDDDDDDDDSSVKYNVTLKRIDLTVIDIASNSNHLFIVDDNGYVLKINPINLDVIDTIKLKEDVKFCSHGCKQENEIVKIKEIAMNDYSSLFVTESNQLWASGDQPQIEVTTDQPKKVIFFEGRNISSISCGQNFSVVVARKVPKLIKDDTDSENDIDEVFLSNCPQCLNNITVSQSVTSSDTCPIGDNPQQYSENHSIASISPMSCTEIDKQRILLSNHMKEDERKNPIFINTEAARLFLTKQLSWVSSYSNGKDNNNQDNSTGEYISNPTGLIKQNVSTMATLVFEGVKTMGDKVATLSRHYSGSLEMNDMRDDIIGDFECIDDPLRINNTTSNSLAHSLRCEEFPWSSSTASLEHELSQQGLNERINQLVDTGNNLLSTELWTWGDIKFGQLGTGDNIKRPKPVLVAKLHNTGIKKVSCGSYHVVALTLDGRVFGWGKNDCNQLNSDSINESSPKLINIFGNKRGKDIAAGNQHSLIVIDNELYYLGKLNDNNHSKLVKLNITDNKKQEYSLKFISTMSDYTCCSTINNKINNNIIINDLNNEEIYLEEMIIIYQNLIKPFQKKGINLINTDIYDTLCRCYYELMNLIGLNVLSICDYSNNIINETYEIFLISNVDEFITVYKYYLNAICDVICLNGFYHMAKIITLFPAVLIRLFNDQIYQDSKKFNNEDIIAIALLNPLQKINRYKSIISNLIKINGTNMGIERLQEALIKWEKICDEVEKRQKEAEITKKFWNNSGKLTDVLRSPERRLIRESRSHPISILNQSRFSSHWFILLTDIFIHVIGASHTVHPLTTLWVELLPDSETVSNALSITAPEDNLILYTASPAERNEWLQALQNAIRNSLPRVVGLTPPRDRTSSYLFLKHPIFKDAKYTGRWSNGKPHGSGKMEWADGRLYTGQFCKGVIHLSGKMEMPTQGIYEGQWKDGQQNGYGSYKYINGDVYDGYFKDGQPHGHGVKKEGHFMASVATVYIGEWVAGVKQGYGVIDDIMTGEKYLGMWSNDMKHGSGLIVTLDGIYYEGLFVQDVMTGHGVMVFEDGTHYEGDFKSAGIFSGKGVLTFVSGDSLEGNINGAWNEPVKVTATLHINKANASNETKTKPPSFGKLCVPSDQKWKAIFRQCYQHLGIPDTSKAIETPKLWQNTAVLISKSHQKSLYKVGGSPQPKSDRESKKNISDLLNKIPQFGRDTLTINTYKEVHEYLLIAFESRHHPLGCLLIELADVYTATYGGVRVHPLLLSHAVAELHSITERIYEIVVLFFPALPKNGKELVLESDSESKVISAAAILHPILLPRVHSALFVLYALHNKKEDDAYWERLVKWNKQPDITLMAFLDIDQKFWKTNISLNVNSLTSDCESFFPEAIETLQQLKTTFSPLEKLVVIRNTFEQMTKTVQKQLGIDYLWTMDELFPVFNFVVVRASILQLGSEIHFIEDFMEPYLQNGELGIMFTTLKACYYQILQEKMNLVD